VRSLPLPIAHSAAGFASYLAFARCAGSGLASRKTALLAGLALFAANLPDLDFVPGILTGQPGYFHHGASHSLFATLLGAVALWLVTSKYLHEVPRAVLFSLVLTATTSHLLLDFLTVDHSSPYGIPVFWPFSNEHYISATPLFLNANRVDSSNAAFFASLFSLHNLRAAALEVTFAAALLSMMFLTRHPLATSKFWVLVACCILSTAMLVSLHIAVL
jgi:membrane-bound metal-dependent hydrolase YbcI (DUF457 family)